MKKSKFTEEQIIGILKEQEQSNTKVADIGRKHGISEQTFHNWKKKYGGLTVDELRRMKELEQENRRREIPPFEWQSLILIIPASDQ